MKTEFPNTVFVFGSNLKGIHGAGAAKFAKKIYSAEQGVGFGFTGRGLGAYKNSCFAFPTKSEPNTSLSLDEIQEYAYEFLSIAEENPDIYFQLTRVGCGLAGFKDEDIFPLFQDRPDNVILPYKWSLIENPEIPKRIIIAGGREFSDYELLKAYCSKMISNISGNIEIISGVARGADLLGEKFAEEMGIPVVRFKAHWDCFKYSAGEERNERMGWYASHLIAFWNSTSTGTKNMIDIAQREGIPTRVAQVLY